MEGTVLQLGRRRFSIIRKPIIARTDIVAKITNEELNQGRHKERNG